MIDLISYQECIFTAEFDGSRQSYLLLPPPLPEQAEILVVALHGHGSHQEQCMTPGIYSDAFGALMRLAQARNLLYVTPEYRGNSWMNTAAEADMQQIIRTLRREYPTIAQVIMVGGSMGGTSALIYAVRHADGVDAVIALCPATDITDLYWYLHNQDGVKGEIAETLAEQYGGTPKECPAEYEARSSRRHTTRITMQLIIVHGAADELIPVEHSRALVCALGAARREPRYMEIPNGNHDAPVASYGLRDLIEPPQLSG